MPRFVILEHDHPVLHWDLMLEAGDALRTWRLAMPPSPGQAGTAHDLASHRKMYLDYEGPVSDNRGQVARWDAGTLTWMEDGPDQVVVDLSGQRFTGRLELRRRQGDEWNVVATGH
ncbi:MAG: DNA polymerase ligase N-terminal domain-containing protein [Gemmataceae bacterium]